MANDPFKNNGLGQRNPFSTHVGGPKRTPPARRSDNFVESVRDIGANTLNSLKNDVVKGTAQSVFDQILGSTSSGQAPKVDDAPNFYEDWIAEREKHAAEQAKMQERAFQQHRQSEQQVVFSMTDEKVKSELQSIRQELALLVKGMNKVQTQIDNAIMDNVVDPGVYHLNYFRNLKTWIIFMRKSLEDASSWASVGSHRANSKGYYWKQFGKSGTKYSMSSERNVQMGAG